MLKLEADEILIDPKELAFDVLKPEIERAMHVVMADHSRKASSGQAPDGGAQKRNSPEYARRKATEGIKIGARRQRGTLPTILTGEMYGSRQIKSESNEVKFIFTGRDNAMKARSLVAKGYKIHYMSKNNIDYLTKRIAKFIDLERIFAVKRKT